MHGMKKRLYIACALTSVPNSEKSTYMSFIDEIKKRASIDYEVIDFLSAIKKDPNPQDVYSFDMACLEKAHYMLAFLDYPGTGLGYELCHMIQVENKPVLALTKDMSHVSKLIRGIKSESFVLDTYNEIDDCIGKLTSFVNLYDKKSKNN